MDFYTAIGILYLIFVAILHIPAMGRTIFSLLIDGIVRYYKLKLKKINETSISN